MPLENSRDRGNLTKAFSNLRLLSFLFIFFIFLISGSTVLIVATQTKENILSLTKDEIRATAAIAALRIDGDKLAGLQAGDEAAPSFVEIRDQLRAIRRSDDKIRYIYTMRRTPFGVAFVVDADYGLAGDAAAIGQTYPEVNPDLLMGFSIPSADRDLTTDEWGTVLSGYAPIRTRSGDVAGIIGIDMDQTRVASRISYLNGVFFLVGILATLAAVVGIVVIERRRSIDEELIMANRNYLTRVFESVQAGIIIVEAGTHRIIDANPAALSLIGASRSTLIGTVCHLFISPADSGTSPITELAPTVGTPEWILLTAEGHKVPTIRYVVPVVLDGVPSFLVTFIDITDRKKAEEDLLAAVRKLKVLSIVTRNDIISDIYALAGYLELVKDDFPDLAKNPLSEKIAWVMERIRLKSAFFKDYDDAGTKEPVWQDVTGLVNVAADRLRTRQTAIRVECTGLEIYADPLVYKVFSSLFDNTLRHGVNATEVLVHCAIKDRNMVISFEDNGAGIPTKDKERIFERGVGKGTGLGLFLARTILGNTGLAIRETGEPGRGARFEITVPEGKYRSLAR